MCLVGDATCWAGPGVGVDASSPAFHSVSLAVCCAPSPPPQSNTLNLTGGVAYTYCIYARLGPGSPASVNTVLYAVRALTYVQLTPQSVPLALTSTYKQFCITVTPTATSQVLFLVPLNVAAATFNFDEGSLAF